MTSGHSDDPLLVDFGNVISLLEKNLKYVDSVGVDASLLQNYRKILSYLRARPASEIRQIIGGQPQGKKSVVRKSVQLTDDEITKLTVEQLHALLLQDLSRTLLERIASVRFSVTKGALSTLRSRDALKEKLATLLSHEGTHESISRVVKSSDPAGND